MTEDSHVSILMCLAGESHQSNSDQYSIDVFFRLSDGYTSWRQQMKFRLIKVIKVIKEKDMAQWLERGALQMSLPAVRFWIPLGACFQRNIMFLPSQSRDIVNMLCLWARHFILKCFTWLRWKWVPGRTEMAMCTISSMRRNGCRTVCSPWSWNGTRMNRSSDQGVRCKVGW